MPSSLTIPSSLIFVPFERSNPSHAPGVPEPLDNSHMLGDFLIIIILPSELVRTSSPASSTTDPAGLCTADVFSTSEAFNILL